MAALLKPPKLAIRVPATSGPIQAMKRGVLKQNAAPVARILVGNSSGSHTGIHEYRPRLKNPFTHAAARSRFRSWVHRKTTGVVMNARAK